MPAPERALAAEEATLAADAESVAGHRPTVLGDRLRTHLRSILTVELALFVLLAAVAWHGRAPDRVDASVARALYASPGTVARTIAELITGLGKPIVVAVASVAVAAWMWRRVRDPLLSAFCPLAVVITAGAGHGAKLLIERHRPATAAIAHEVDFSFPSGHATGAAALAAATILLMCAVGVRRRRLVGTALVLYAAAISTSRLVIGVHYLSDVVAGSVFGLAGVLVLGLLFSSAERRLR